ncbi:MAG: YjfK family protein [Saccharospirillaceae bacterium]|nr:YjfK family protein [Pseudomonadales bacterium]NRB79510.1 YjfK family protein [Saccharospirillaceae bacterium]
MGFFNSLFKKNKEVDTSFLPSIMGLAVGTSFEIDSLHLKLILPKLTIKQCNNTQIINDVGYVNLDGTHIFRFYTDDEAFLQVICEGGKEEQNIVDVKLFHYYDTLDIGSQNIWDELLNEKIGVSEYELAGNTYQRVWTSASDYHNPVVMQEKNYDHTSEDINDYDSTDQFTMLFEREIGNEDYEALFLSAEECQEENGTLTRSFVISTGMSLSPSQIHING